MDLDFLLVGLVTLFNVLNIRYESTNSYRFHSKTFVTCLLFVQSMIWGKIPLLVSQKYNYSIKLLQLNLFCCAEQISENYLLTRKFESILNEILNLELGAKLSSSKMFANRPESIVSQEVRFMY